MRGWLPKRFKAAPLSRANGNRVGGITLAAVLLLTGWMLGLLLFFPTTALETRIETEVTTRMHGQGHLDLEGLAMRLPLGLSVRRATLHLPRSPIPEIALTNLKVTPLWLSLLSGNPGLTFECGILGGQAEGSLRSQGDIRLAMQQVRFVVPVMQNSPIEAAGTLEQGELEAHWPPTEKSQSRLSLTIGQGRVTGLEAVGATDNALEIGTLVLAGKGIGTAFKLEQLESRDGQLILNGGGALLLANPIDRSRINLTGTLKPGPALSPQLQDLLSVVSKEVNGSYPFQVSGTLARPRIK